MPRPTHIPHAVLALLLAVVEPAFAQLPASEASGATATPQLPPDGAAQQPVDLRLKETVEVTGTRGTIDSEKTPVASTVVTRREIEQRNVRTVDQAVNAVEGVAAYRTRGVADNGAGIGMRGFSGRSSGQSRVLVLLDGQPINDPYLGSVDWATVPIEEVDRVEVVRGPFSSLYGGNAMGGVVNVLTRPVDRRSFETFAQHGTYGTGSYSGRYADRWFGRLGLTVGYAHLRTAGYSAQVVTRPASVSTPGGGVQVTGAERVATATGGVAYAVGARGENWYRQHAVRARGEYTVNAQTIATFQFIRQSKTTGWGDYSSSLRAEGGGVVDSGNLVFQEGDVWRRITLSPGQFLGARQGGASNTYQLQLMRGTSRGQWRVQAGVADTPRAWTSIPNPAAATLHGGPGSYTDQSFRGVFANVQWSTTPGRRHAIAVGVDTRRDGATVVESPILDYLTDRPLPSRNTYSNGRTLSQGLYAQDQLSISDRLSVTLGGRYDYWKTFDGETQSAPEQPARPIDGRDAGALTGKVSAIYAAVTGTAIRASVGTAFRNPSVFEMYRDLLDSGILLLGNPQLEPERLLAWETGARQQLGSGVTIDATVYRNRITSLIYRATDLVADPGGQTRRMLNAGEGTTTGLELGVTARPASWLTARPTYTFTDALITRNPRIPATVGKQIPFVPRHSAAVTVSAALRSWSATVTGRYQSDVFATETNTDVVNGVPGSYEDFFEADLAVAVTPTPRVSLQLTAENLFDRRYFMFYRNPGRVVSAGIRLRYGAR
jgi:iron complex outermembrane recepter protein